MEVADLCDVLQVFVSDDQALAEVVRTIAAALQPRHLFCSHATVSPEAARRAAAIVESQGARYLDAPFTGSKAAAQNRQLVYYVGGKKETLEEARPILEATSKQIVELGQVGDASTLKVATNMLTAATVQTLSEALAVVRSAGIDGQRLVEALEHNASQSPASAMKLPAMLARNFEANFSLKHMLKDVRLARGIAAEKDVSLPVMNAIEAVFAEGIDEGWGEEDFCGIARAYDGLLPEEPEEPVPAAQAPVMDDEASAAAAPEPVSTEDAAPEPVSTEDAAPEPEAAATSEPVPEELPTTKIGLPPIGGDPVTSQPRKGTLRIIRDLFKPA